MTNSNFGKDGVVKSGKHWLLYFTLAVLALTIYIGKGFFNDDSFHLLPLKNFGVTVDINVLVIA